MIGFDATLGFSGTYDDFGTFSWYFAGERRFSDALIGYLEQFALHSV